MVVFINKDKYGDWQCRYCGRHFDDTRALHRRQVGDYRVPVCPICNVLLPIIGEDRHFSYQQRKILEILSPLAHKKRVIRAEEGMAMDENSLYHPDLPVYRVYVTVKGSLKVRERKERVSDGKE